MNLRGACGILITGGIAAVKYFILAASIKTIILTTLCFIPLMGMGYVYAYFGTKKAYEKFTNGGNFSPTAKAEFAMGLPIALSIITAIFI